MFEPCQYWNYGELWRITELWSLKMIYTANQCRNPGNPLVSFLSESEGLRTRNINGISSSLRVGED